MKSLFFLIGLDAIFGQLNHRFIRLLTTIGLMQISPGLSLLLILGSLPGWNRRLRHEGRSH